VREELSESGWSGWKDEQDGGNCLNQDFQDSRMSRIGEKAVRHPERLFEAFLAKDLGQGKL